MQTNIRISKYIFVFKTKILLTLFVQSVRQVGTTVLSLLYCTHNFKAQLKYNILTFDIENIFLIFLPAPKIQLVPKCLQYYCTCRRVLISCKLQTVWSIPPLLCSFSHQLADIVESVWSEEEWISLYRVSVSKLFYFSKKNFFWKIFLVHLKYEKHTKVLVLYLLQRHYTHSQYRYLFCVHLKLTLAR